MRLLEEQVDRIGEVGDRLLGSPARVAARD